MKKNDFEKLKKRMLSKKINYKKLGNLNTLKGTDNIYWYAYSGKLNISFKSIKKTNIVIEVWNGKKPVVLKNKIEKIKFKDCLKWYQKIRIEILSTLKAIIAVAVYLKTTKRIPSGR